MWSLSNASSSHFRRARYEQRAYGTGRRVRPGLQGIWTTPGVARRLFLGSRRAGSVHFGPKRHGQERDAQTPHGFVEALTAPAIRSRLTWKAALSFLLPAQNSITRRRFLVRG